MGTFEVRMSRSGWKRVGFNIPPDLAANGPIEVFVGPLGIRSKYFSRPREALGDPRPRVGSGAEVQARLLDALSIGDRAAMRAPPNAHIVLSAGSTGHASWHLDGVPHQVCAICAGSGSVLGLGGRKVECPVLVPITDGGG